MNVLIKRIRPTATLPAYQTSGSAAADVSACLEEAITLQPGERVIVPTGLSMSIPDGFEVQVRARSGLSAKHGICLANGVGTIDADYRGEVGVILINLGKDAFVIEHGMRIAQLVVARYEAVTWQEVDALDETARGGGGYGSTGH